MTTAAAPAAITANLDRAKLFLLISALETDLRAILREYVLPYLSEENVFGKRHELLLQRASRDEAFAGGSLSLLDYADFADSFELINQHKVFVPDEVAAPVRELTARLGAMVPRRNRVMHIRPLDPDDLECSLTLCIDAVERLPLQGTRQLLSRLLEDPSWQPLMPVGVSAPASVINNLPFPDFDETGLLGRGDANLRLLDMLLAARHPVLTIIGEGGMGKTALVVKTLYDLIDHPECPYDAVLWASLKTERLTGEGVEAVRDAALDVIGVSHHLGSAIDGGFDGTAGELADVLDGTVALVVIDNVETADTEEIVRFYDAMPATCKFLLTSRVGLGQVERRIPLDPLPPKSAVQMLRGLAQHRGVRSLATSPQAALEKQVERLRATPLAIRWYVESVAAGGEPNVILGDQEELLRFCLETVHRDLSELGRFCLSTLYAAGQPLDSSHLAAITNAKPDDLNRALQDLQRRSLIEVQQGGRDGLHRRYAPTPATAQYLASVDRPAGETLKTVREELSAMRRAEEQRQKKNPFDPKAVRIRDDRDTGTAYLLQKAINAPRGSETRNALLAQAMPLAPDWHETHRVAAFLFADDERYEAARDSYERALELAEDPTDKAIVQMFFAYELASHLNEPGHAVELAEDAHTALGTPETACRLGQCLMIDRKFDAAEALFRTVLTAESTHSVLVARTQLMNLTKRRMERLRNDRRPLEAARLGAGGLREVTAYLDTGVSDGRLREQCLALCAEVFFAAVDVEDLNEVATDLEFVARYANSRIEELRLSQHAGRLVAAAHRVAGRTECAEPLRTAIVRIETHFNDGAPGELVTGHVTSFDAEKGFGFITRPGLEVAVFLHRSELRDPSDQIFLLVGAPVSFVLERTEKGLQAIRVRVEIPAAEQADCLRQRSSAVTLKLERHLFAREERTGATVYVDKRAMADADWSKVHERSRLMCDLQQSARSPAARFGTVTLVG